MRHKPQTMRDFASPDDTPAPIKGFMLMRSRPMPLGALGSSFRWEDVVPGDVSVGASAGWRPKRDDICSSSVTGFRTEDSAVSVRLRFFSFLSAHGIHGQKRLHMPHLDSSPLRLRHLQQPHTKSIAVVPPTSSTLPTDSRMMDISMGTAKDER